MSEIKVNKISPKQTCTQLTLGDSGDTIIIPANTTTSVAGTLSVTGNLLSDTLKNANSSTLITQTNATTITIGGTGQTVTLASGASQSGFGRAGTVNWSSTVRTSDFTAVSGNGYFINTTSGAVTITLPATPTSGDIVGITDYAGTAATNNITIGRNGSNIEGSAANAFISTNRDSITLVYIDSTQGWLPVSDNTGSNLSPFIIATGGTVLTCGCYKTHVFTSSGCFVVSNSGNPLGSNTVEYLVVAGGGGANSGNRNGGAGGGGYRQNYPSPVTAGLPVSNQTYPITVGGGGSAGGGSPGGNSIFSTITSAGGAPGATPGGSGGGGGSEGNTGGTGNSPPVTPSQGSPGGNTGGGCAPGGGGGGGAAGSGGNGTPGGGGTPGGAGGPGSPIATAFFGPTSGSYGTPGPAPGRYFSGGGGGGVYGGATAGGGGTGGGGAGSPPSGSATNGTANTGGGGGGGTYPPAGPPTRPGGTGGSGIVVIRYKYK